MIWLGTKNVQPENQGAFSAILHKVVQGPFVTNSQSRKTIVDISEQSLTLETRALTFVDFFYLVLVFDRFNLI